MGWDCGFDIYPRLDPDTRADKEAYQYFKAELMDKYEDERDDDSRRPDGKVLQLPFDADHEVHKLYMLFAVGKYPGMPFNAGHCNYFLRFSSKVSGGLSAPAEPYIKAVCKIARKHFGSRVHFWHEMCETDDERQWGMYDLGEVHQAARELRALGEELEKD